MYLELTEEEAHLLILKGLGLDADATLRTRGELQVLKSHHKIVIKAFGEAGSIFALEPIICGGNCSCKTRPEIPDDCFVVDPEEDAIAKLEENLDGT